MRAAVALMLALAARVSPFPAALTADDDALLHAYPTTIVARDIRLARCADVDTLEGMLAYATVEVTAHVPFPGVDKQGRYYGRTVFAIRHVTLRMPRAIGWPNMTDGNRTAVRAMLGALRHHEAGHVRVAASEVARLDAAPLTVTSDPEVYRHTEMRRQTAGLAAIAQAQRAYDALTDHGRHQRRAPGTLAGPDTELRCGQ